ncbi:hypothetical protein FKW77_009882 [Venturia effusa]|uniref:BTB domain-containing protein n=1 Tax=Venturia effusa TaxID=50376 RepID=A0A517L090_9PEZI|nr:hypothetical protein FKW77_009882 [Venturia effusa]
MADNDSLEIHFTWLQNVKVVAKKDGLERSFIVPEALLRRPSEVLAGILNKLPRTGKIATLDIETTPLAFGELLMFLYHGEVIARQHAYYGEIRDLIILLIEVCALAEKLAMRDLYNHSLGVLHDFYLEFCDDTEFLVDYVHRAYDITPENSTLRKLTMMFLACEGLGAGIKPEDSSFVHDIRELLDDKEDAEMKGADYFEQLIKLVLQNPGYITFLVERAAPAANRARKILLHSEEGSSIKVALLPRQCQPMQSICDHVRTLQLKYSVFHLRFLDSSFTDFISFVASKCQKMPKLSQINLDIMPTHTGDEYDSTFDVVSVAKQIAQRLKPLSSLGKPIFVVINEAAFSWSPVLWRIRKLMRFGFHDKKELWKFEFDVEAGWTSPGAAELVDNREQLVWPDVKKRRGWSIDRSVSASDGT